MKFAVFSDVHCHNYKEHSTIDEGVNSRLKICVNSIKRVGADCYERGIKTAFMCGDMFHVRGQIRPSVLNEVVDALKFVTKSCGVDLYMIPGNHDLENYREGGSSIDALDLIDGVTVIKEPDVIYTREENLMVLGIPYMHGAEQFKDCYENMLAMHPAVDVVLMHQYIDDFIPSVIGKTGISACWLASKIKNGGVVFSGHYHERNYAVTGDNVVFNVGALLPQKFGDSGSYGHVILQYALGDGFVDVPPTVVETIAPKFITINATPSKTDKSISGNYIRIITDTPVKAEKIKERCLELGAYSVVAQIIRPEYMAKEDKRPVISISSTESMIKEYLRSESCIVPVDVRSKVYDLFQKICVDK